MTQTSQIQKKIPDTSGLVKKLHYNAKITEIENKIPSITGLSKTSALTALETKIPIISSLVKKKKTDYNTNITEIEKKLTDHDHDKNVNNPEFNNLTARVFTERLTKQILQQRQFLMTN